MSMTSRADAEFLRSLAAAIGHEFSQSDPKIGRLREIAERLEQGVAVQEKVLQVFKDGSKMIQVTAVPAYDDQSRVTNEWLNAIGGSQQPVADTWVFHGHDSILTFEVDFTECHVTERDGDIKRSIKTKGEARLIFRLFQVRVEE